MLKPTKEAFLKHDLYTWDFTDLGKAYPLDKLPEVKPKKVASAGLRFVYCATDRKDAQHGWYADAGNGTFRAGNCGFGKMHDSWAEEHLTDPTPLEGQRWREPWDNGCDN